MFERFTDRARRVVVLAQEQAMAFNHDYIGTEHLLLGLLTEGEGVAAQALTSVDVSLSAARQQVDEIIGHGPRPPSGHIPFTPAAKSVLEASLRESLRLGHSHIGTEHLLLAVLAERDSAAVRILRAVGTDLERLRDAVMKLAAARSADGDSSRIHSLLNETRRLRDLLRKHGIDPEEPDDAPTTQS